MFNSYMGGLNAVDAVNGGCNGDVGGLLQKRLR